MYYGLNPCFDDLYRKSKEGYNFVHLMDLIGSKENIMLAYRNIKSNKGSNTPGVDGMTIDVQAHAIQAAGFDDADAAWTAFAQQHN